MARDDKPVPKRGMRAPCILISESLISPIAAKKKLKSSREAKYGADPIIASKTDLL
jgi:hypothetical protein